MLLAFRYITDSGVNEGGFAAAVGSGASTVAALVMCDDDTELAPKQAGYTLTANGATQPGG